MQPPGVSRPKLAAVPPGAHRRADGIEVWRFWAPVLAVALWAAWRTADYGLHAGPGPAWHTPGPVSAPHATWEADCAACHPSVTPI